METCQRLLRRAHKPPPVHQAPKPEGRPRLLVTLISRSFPTVHPWRPMWGCIRFSTAVNNFGNGSTAHHYYIIHHFSTLERWLNNFFKLTVETCWNCQASGRPSWPAQWRRAPRWQIGQPPRRWLQPTGSKCCTSWTKLKPFGETSKNQQNHSCKMLQRSLAKCFQKQTFLMVFILVHQAQLDHWHLLSVCFKPQSKFYMVPVQWDKGMT